jgi:hypothetical protein
MSSILRVAVVLTLGTGVMAAAQENPLIGSWKLNPEESDITGRTVVVKQMGPDELEVTLEGKPYTVKLDGKERPSLFGYTEAWTKTGDNQWRSVVTLNGKPISTDTYRLSANGKTLTLTSTGERADGGRFEDQVTYRRAEPAESPTGTSGGAAVGLAGTWKGEDFSSKSPGTLEITASGPDGITMRTPMWATEANVKFDGKDHPITSPMLPAGFTVSMTRSGPKEVEASYKQDGKLVWTSTWTVSPDGRKLTVVERVPGQAGMTKSVFDRQ